MAEGRALKNKSFYGAGEMGGRPDIEMPPLHESSPVLTSGPDLFGQPQQAQPQQEQGFFSVPDSVNFEEQDMPEAPQQEKEPETEEEVPKHYRSSKTNLRLLAEKAEKAERERDELMRMLMQSQQRQNPAPQEHVHEEEEHDEPDLDPEALVDGKYLNKMKQEMRKVKQELRNFRAQSAQEITEARIKAQFPDFDKVVSADNIAMLNEMHPELARTLRDTPDMYNKAASAYKVIKQFGIYQETKLDPDAQRAVRNAQKPRPLASISPQQAESPLSRANAFAQGEFSDDLKKQLWKEMKNARKN